MTQINRVKKSKAVFPNVDRFWDEGKTLEEFIAEGKQEGENIGFNKGRQEGRLKGLHESQIITLVKTILKLNYKGFSAQEISNILEEEIYFINYIIAKK